MNNKKVLIKAVKELNKAKAPAKQKDIVTDPMGQWKYPGQVTRIPSDVITMQGVNYPVWAQPSVGPGTMMMPGQDYNFPGADYVDEYPQMRKGGMLKLPKMPKPSKKGVLGKAYSKSLDATNRLFTENKLFEKPKSKKRKIFDPKAKYQDGGELEYIETELTPEEIQSYRDGGYVVEDISVPELTQAQRGITISDPKEYAYRKAAYDDSLYLYKNNSQPLSRINSNIVSDNIKDKPKPYRSQNSTAKYTGKPVESIVYGANDEYRNLPIYLDNVKKYQGTSPAFINYNKSKNFTKQIPTNKPVKIDKRVEYYHPQSITNPFTGKTTGLFYPGQNEQNAALKEVYKAARFKKPVQPVYFADNKTKDKPVNKTVKNTPAAPVKVKSDSFSPIYVTNPLDPRLTAYDDSLRLYNNYATADANFKKRGDKKNAITKPGRPGEYEYVHKEISPNVIVSQSEKNPDFHPTIKPTGRVSYDLKKPRVYKNGTLNGVPYEGLTESKDFINVFKKPVQPVIYKKPEEQVFADVPEKLQSRSINSLPQNAELAKIPVKSTPQKRNFVSPGPRKTFSTMEWDADKQDFVETKRANRSTKVGDGSASQEYLVDGKPISAEKLAELNAISARAKQRPQLTPAQMEEMQLMSTQFAYGGNLYQGGGQLGSGMLAQQIRQSKNAPKKPLAVDNPRLGPTKQSNQGNTATITPNNKLPQTLNTVRDPEAERKALEKQTRELVQSGAASRSLDTLRSSDKSLYEQTKDALLTDPNFLNKVKKNEYKYQQELEQKAYDDASYLQRGVNFGTAFLSNPITTGANLLEGYRPLMNQAEVLRDPNNPQNVLMRNTGGLDDVFNMFNPGSYVANYNSNIKKGDYSSAALDAADILLAPTVLGRADNATDLTSAFRSLADDGKKLGVKAGSYFPEYKNVYRVEPTTFVKDADDQLSGRWMGELDQMPFYVKNLKDPEGGVRIMRQKMPVKKWQSMSGHNMPFNAKLMSAGTGEYKTLNNAVTAGELSPGAAKRLSVDSPLQSDWEEITFNPKLINLSEGIVPERLANKLRTQKPNRFLSSRDLIEYPAGDLGREGAINHLLNIRGDVEKPIIGIPRKYFPFAQGGEYVDAELTPEEIEEYKAKGYIVEELY